MLFNYRMCVAVRRNNYPLDNAQMLPAHTITVMAPITLRNLLPYEITYEAGIEGGRILPGSSADLHCSNLDEQLQITIHLDGYPGPGVVRIVYNSEDLSFSYFIFMFFFLSYYCIYISVIIKNAIIF